MTSAAVAWAILIGMEVKEVRRESPALAHVIVVDDHGHERTLRVTPGSVDEVEQDVLIPVSDELENLARNAVGPMGLDPTATLSADDLADLAGDVPRPRVGGGAAGFDPKSTLPMPTSSRPHIGTGEVPLPELGPSTDEFDSLEDLAAEEERVSKPHFGSGPTTTAPQDPNMTQKLPVQELLDDDDD